jgi:prevent-host-death family protein
MKTMTITDFKAHALRVVSEVAERKEPVRITKRGAPIAEVVPYAEAKPAAGKLAETLVFEKDIVGPLGEELWDVCR